MSEVMDSMLTGVHPIVEMVNRAGLVCPMEEVAEIEVLFLPKMSEVKHFLNINLRISRTRFSDQMLRYRCSLVPIQ